MSTLRTPTGSCMSNELPTHVFLQISIAGQRMEDLVVIELDTIRCPQTCRNFVTLISNPDKTSRKDPKPSYKGCEFHRVIPQFMVQTGDFQNFDGSGGHAVLDNGRTATFADEDFAGKHDRAGIVSMANKGKDTNGSQFFITLKATPHLDRKHVTFGRVTQGMGVIDKMIHVERDGDRPFPMQRIEILDCGIGIGIDDTGKERKRKKKERRHTKSSNVSSSNDGDDDSSHTSSSSTQNDRRKRKDLKKYKSSKSTREHIEREHRRPKKHKKSKKKRKH